MVGVPPQSQKEPLLRGTTTMLWSNQADQVFDAMKSNPSLQTRFFDHVVIGEDGGLSEIGNKEEMWYDTRFLSSAVILLFVVYNIVFLLSQDLGAIFKKPEPYTHFLLTNSILSQIGIEVDSPQKIMSVVELLMLFVLLSFALKHCKNILFRSGFCKWQATAHLCWFTLPDLSCYSAIKVLQFVTPQQLMYDLNYVLWYEPKATQNLKLVMLLVRTPLAWIIGLDTFLIKVRLANSMIMQRRCQFQDVLGVIILMVQILGVVQIGKTIKNRLYRFVFAGEDGMMTNDERVRQDVWEAMVAERIFDKFPFHKAAALMLSWCDDDFQMLALNDAESPHSNDAESSHSSASSNSSEFYSGHSDDDDGCAPQKPIGPGGTDLPANSSKACCHLPRCLGSLFPTVGVMPKAANTEEFGSPKQFGHQSYDISG
mmetsp:Transcript_132858/g.265093  ORF Transcript_132858/g.265093 Transcript_132858/m.265093 type:complete len:427 (-) Transcript_132858:107-1387(-)